MMRSHSFDWSILSTRAWEARENAFILGKTKVGAALLTDRGQIYTGCNVEQTFRSHDIHAEVNAIGNMIAGSGNDTILAILVVAERNLFTPCGSCMDWIIQFGGGDVLIGFQKIPGGQVQAYRASELMPYYPH